VRVGGSRRLGVEVDGRRASTAAPGQTEARGQRVARTGTARLEWAERRRQHASASRAKQRRTVALEHGDSTRGRRRAWTEENGKGLAAQGLAVVGESVARTDGRRGANA
jgi:hypothetical protein